ncbi:MAG: lanthionine synthetase LanC family protein, partial [Actinomycetes bacterium]
CNGLPGIVLARAVVRGLSPRLVPDTVTADLRRAEPALAKEVQTVDTLCCGTSGRAEVLRYLIWSGSMMADTDSASAGTADAEYRRTLGQLATRTLEGRLRLGVPADSPLPVMGLFQGSSGVLYTLLAATSATLPHPLTWLPGWVSSESLGH